MKKTSSPAKAAGQVDTGQVKSLLAQLDKKTPVADRVEQERVITALLNGSPILGETLTSHPDWASVIEVQAIRHPRRAQGFRAEVEGWLKPRLAQQDYAGALEELRRFKQREMLRIAARDLARYSNVVELTREISDVADTCLDSVWRICRQQLEQRYGRPYHQDADGDWQPTTACVLGMGKLGGQELNYSSDVDVLFVYSDEGHVFKEPPGQRKAPDKGLSSHQYFNRLAEAFIAEVARMTGEGVLFRIDLRLRPEGDAGPLSRSLASYETYYAQWGQTWERMMLIKARGVAGDLGLAAEFLESVQSFRYPRFVNENVLREVRAMKLRIEREIVGTDSLERNVKLGRGGIREIEFTAQSLQLLNGGRQPFLQGAQTLPTLVKLTQYNLLEPAEATELTAAYYFLRDVEHRLQMVANQQTHTIPVDRVARERLAEMMGCGNLPAFEKALQTHTGNVRRVYDRLLKSDTSEVDSSLPVGFEGSEIEWEKLLAERSFRDPAAAFRRLREFAEGPGFVHVSTRTTELARVLIPKLLAMCPLKGRPWKAGDVVLSDPDRVLSRVDSFISAYGTRAALFELWNSNPQVFTLLLLLFDRSEFLAEVAIRTPDLVDELVSSGRMRQQRLETQMLQDLRHGAADKDQFAWLRRYHEAEWLRLGLRDILGLVDFEQNLSELSALADACLQYALEVVMRRHKLKKPPFVIIGLGKLGGSELTYGSDLDIQFITAVKPKDLPKLQKLAVEVMELMSKRTEQGMVYETDARLRPDGEKGLLVNSIDAYEEYYRKRAQLWEIQSLTRIRPVAGDLEVGQQFRVLAKELTNFKQFGGPDSDKKVKPPAGYTADWKAKIHDMRMRIEKERTPAGQDDLAIKTGRGGLMDAEFIAQSLCLEHGWQEAHTLRVLESARDLDVLPEAEKLLENYRRLRRVEGILRRWSYEGETVLPDDPAPYYRVSVRCGFVTPEAFRTALAQWRAAIREVYLKVFPS